MKSRKAEQQAVKQAERGKKRQEEARPQVRKIKAQLKDLRCCEGLVELAGTKAGAAGGALLTLFLCVLLSGCTPPMERPSSSRPEAVDSSVPTTGPEETLIPVNVTINRNHLGQESHRVHLDRAVLRPYIGSENLGTRSPDGSAFLVIIYDLTNTSSQTIRLTASDGPREIITSDGLRFAPDNRHELYVRLTPEFKKEDLSAPPLLTVEAQPGVPVKLFALFQLPLTAMQKNPAISIIGPRYRPQSVPLFPQSDSMQSNAPDATSEPPPEPATTTTPESEPEASEPPSNDVEKFKEGLPFVNAPAIRELLLQTMGDTAYRKFRNVIADREEGGDLEINGKERFFSEFLPHFATQQCFAYVDLESSRCVAGYLDEDEVSLYGANSKDELPQSVANYLAREDLKIHFLESGTPPVTKR